MTRAPIEGKVAQILSSRELVINRGTDDGVQIGMLFDVLSARAESIEDPDTGEVLGSVYRPKIQVRVTTAEARLAVARTFKFKEVNVGGMGTGMGISKLFDPPKFVKRYETLKAEDAAWGEDIDETESFVKIGDPILEVVAGQASDDPGAGARTLGTSGASPELAGGELDDAGVTSPARPAERGSPESDS